MAKSILDYGMGPIKNPPKNTVINKPSKPGSNVIVPPISTGSSGGLSQEVKPPKNNTIINKPPSSGGTISRPGTPASSGGGTPGLDDLGNIDYSSKWDSALGGGASYDELKSIYEARNDKISQGGAYGQFENDAKGQEMKSYLDRLEREQMEEDIREMNRLQQEAALEALRAAYNKNVAGLDRTQADIAPTYQSARNELAGQSELQKKNFAEYAAANGLNSGAGGQAQLAFTNALQGGLNQIATKEASTLADLELQRTQMEADYENAIAQAKAQGNYELAQQLYSEKVRQDEAMRQQMQWQAQQNLAQQQFQFSKDQAAIGNDQWEKQYQSQLNQWDEGKKYQWAAFLAQYGDFSGLRALGYTDEQIAGLMKKWEQSNYL